jgi:hypothetical protein
VLCPESCPTGVCCRCNPVSRRRKQGTALQRASPNCCTELYCAVLYVYIKSQDQQKLRFPRVQLPPWCPKLGLALAPSPLPRAKGRVHGAKGGGVVCRGHDVCLSLFLFSFSITLPVLIPYSAVLCMLVVRHVVTNVIKVSHPGNNAHVGRGGRCRGN